MRPSRPGPVSAPRWPGCPPHPSCSPRSPPCRPPRTPRTSTRTGPCAPSVPTACAGCCTASAAPLALALALVAMDAVAGLLLPVLIRQGIDEGVRRGALAGVWTAAATRPARGPGPVGRADRRQPHDRAHRRAGPLLAPAQDLRAAPAPRPRLLRARADRQDHDQDDHGRGRAVDVPPDRPGHRPGLDADLLRHTRRTAGHRRPAGPGRLRHPPAADHRHVLLPQAEREGLRTGPRADQRRQR